MVSRSMAFLVWALVAGSAVVWSLKLFTPSQPVPGQAVVAAPAVATGGDLTRLFGVFVPPPPPPGPAVETAPPPPEASRFQLIGVAAAVPAAPRSQGVALIAVDGKPARAYRVGAIVDGEHVLQDVQARTVAIGPRGRPAAISLELPPLPPPATGVPGGGAGAAPAPMSTTPPMVPAPGAVPRPIPGTMPGMVPALVPGSMPRPAAPAPPVPVVVPPPAVPGAVPGLGMPAQGRLRAMSGAVPGTALAPMSPQPTPVLPSPGVPLPVPMADPDLPTPSEARLQR